MLNALIVDDEVSGTKGLERLLNKYCPGVKVLGHAQSIDEAEQKIVALMPDVVFLDIEMPFGSGFDLLNRLAKKDPSKKNMRFEVIFTTAYSQYAIKAFKHNAIDYLLKPIDPDELIEAIKRCEEKKGTPAWPADRKALDYKKIESLISSFSQSGKVQKLPVHTLEGIIFIEASKVLRLEADGNYTNIYLVEGLPGASGKKYTSSRTLKEYEEMFPPREFFRIHKTNLVNLMHVTQYIKGEGGEVLMSDGTILEVSRYKKAELLALLSP
jgi:two-component system, LytTR family, response regulator